MNPAEQDRLYLTHCPRGVACLCRTGTNDQPETDCWDAMGRPSRAEMEAEAREQRRSDRRALIAVALLIFAVLGFWWTLDIPAWMWTPLL